jgi:hypothetical protein
MRQFVFTPTCLCQLPQGTPQGTPWIVTGALIDPGLHASGHRITTGLLAHIKTTHILIARDSPTRQWASFWQWPVSRVFEWTVRGKM